MAAPLFVLIGTALSYIILILVTLTLTAVCASTKDPASLTEVFSLLSLLVGSALSSLILSKLRADGFLMAMLTAAVFVTVRIIISVFLGGVGLSDLLDCVCYLGMACIFSLIGRRRPKRRKR